MDNDNIPTPDLIGWENDLSNLNTDTIPRAENRKGVVHVAFATTRVLHALFMMRQVKFDGVHRLRFLVLTGGTLCVS
jgi:hypothetical protein